MKRTLTMMAVAVVSMVGATTGFGQGATASATASVTTEQPTIKGKLDIKYETRRQMDDSGNPQEGVQDLYKIDVTIGKTLMFQGDIKHLPPIFSTVLGREKQQARLDYAVDLAIANPANLSQKKRIGRLVGGVPIDRKGVYKYNEGTLRIAVDAAGKASEFESRFSGTAAGKPPKVGSVVERAKSQAVTLTKQVKGKTVKLVVTKYDKMDLSDLVLAAGPVKTYPEAHVNGEMLYDYERNAWYFRNVSMSYVVDGKSVTDKLSGNIKWVESPQYDTTGEGEYQFDVRVNEPEVKQGESEAFAPVDDEASFFEADAKATALVGTWKYKDTLQGDTVTASQVTIDLVGNNLTKQQNVNLAKLLVFVSIVPMNSE